MVDLKTWAKMNIFYLNSDFAIDPQVPTRSLSYLWANRKSMGLDEKDPVPFLAQGLKVSS